jgi:hypothetical protein
MMAWTRIGPTLIGLTRRKDFVTPKVTIEIEGEERSVDAVAHVLSRIGVRFEE